MRATTTKEQMPAYEIENITYSCEEPGCGFTTSHKEEADQHYGAAHSVKETATIDGTKFYRFDTEGAYNAWCRTTRKEFDYFYPAKWQGPGWYSLKSWSERCGMNCCYKDAGGTEAATVIMESWRSEIRDQVEKIRSLRALIKKSNGQSVPS